MFRIFTEFEAIHTLSTEIKEELSLVLQGKTIYKGLHLLMAVEISRNLYFVEKGSLKVYYRGNGRQYTSRLMKEGDLAISPQSFFSQSPSTESIVTLKGGKVYYIDYDSFHRLFRKYTSFSYIMLMLLIRDYLLLDQCACAMRTMRAEERYRWLSSNYPWMHQQLKAKEIASLINITDGTLCVVKNRLKVQKIINQSIKI